MAEHQEKFLDGALAAIDERGQILAVRLAQLAELARGRTWDEQTLTELLHGGDVATAFLEAAFRPGSAPAEVRPHRKAARSVLRSLLPLPGRHCDGPVRSFRALLSASGYASQPSRFESLMRILTDELGLVSQASIGTLGAGPDDSADREHCYRLGHDSMIAPLRDWLSGEGARERECGSVSLPEPDIPERVRRIKVNAATQEELTTLPGIGAAMARRLIEAKPLSTIGDLLKVKGIGEKTLRRIGPHIDFG